MTEKFKAFSYNNLPDGVELDRSRVEWGAFGFEYLFNAADNFDGYDLVQIIPARQPNHEAVFIYRRRDE